MSEDQLSALLAKLKHDTGLQEKLKGAADLDAVVAIVKEAGFDVSKADWLKYQANQKGLIQLKDEELEGVSGGVGFYDFVNGLIDHWVQSSWEGSSFEEINESSCFV